jgi:hypothetical protein
VNDVVAAREKGPRFVSQKSVGIGNQPDAQTPTQRSQ